MARTLTSAAATEAAKTSGAFPIRILEVQFPAPTGTKYYSTEALTSPVTAEGRIKRMGEITLSADPGKAGSVGTLDIEFDDADLFFKEVTETAPGIQAVDAFLWLFFSGTTWLDDRILDFGGILTAPMSWEERTATFRATMKGFEHKYDKDIGQLATVDIFPELSCSECENTLIPIAYGAPCYRVPACVIDRPGVGVLGSVLSITDTTLTLSSTAAAAGFTTGSSIALAVGVGQRWERITGSFASGSATSFAITNRGSIEGTGTTTGTTAGTYASGGFTFLTIAEADLTSPTTSRAGNALYVQIGGVWQNHLVTHWSDQGVDRAIAIEPAGVTFPSGGGAPYILLVLAGYVPRYQPGIPVREIGTWKYAVNYLPSAGVQTVEALTKVEAPGGARIDQWLEVNPAYYFADNDDRTFNAALGRTSGQPGLTTVQLSYSPVQLGIDDETIYVTLNGIIDSPPTTTPAGCGSFGDTALTNPADIAEHVLTNPFLGNLPAARVDSSSFATAASAIPTRAAFAILDSKKKLHDFVADLAYQANCIYFWDEGAAHMKKLVHPLSGGDSTLTITKAKYALEPGLKIEEIDVKNYITELQGRFRPSVTSGELVLTRASSAAITDFGINRDEINYWAFQYPTSVALSTEFWLEYLLEKNRKVTFTTWLNGVKLQPGDTITLDIDDGAGNVIFNSVLAQVNSIKRTPGLLAQQQMERVEIECSVSLFSYAVAAAAPSDVTCAGNVSSRAYAMTGKLFLQSSGTDRSLYVAGPAGGGMDGGGIQTPVRSEADPTTNFVVDTGLTIQFAMTPPCP